MRRFKGARSRSSGGCFVNLVTLSGLCHRGSDGQCGLGFIEQKLIALRRTLARPREVLGWDASNPPVCWPGGTPRALISVCQKYLGPKIPKAQGFAIALLAKASQTFSRRRSLWQR